MRTSAKQMGCYLKTTLNIAIDIDGVILDIMTPFCKIFNEKYDASYSLKDITKWDFFLDWHVSEEEFLELFEKIFNNEVCAPLIEKEIPRLMKNLNEKYHVDLLTARNINYREKLIEILAKRGIVKKIHFYSLIMVGNKPQDIKLDYEYDIYVDDNPYLIKAIQKKKYKHLLLFDQPWNQKFIRAKNITRVHGWKEVVEAISQYFII